MMLFILLFIGIVSGLPVVTNIEPSHSGLNGGSYLSIIGDELHPVRKVLVGDSECIIDHMRSTGQLLSCKIPPKKYSSNSSVQVVLKDGSAISCSSCYLLHKEELVPVAQAPAVRVAVAGDALHVMGENWELSNPESEVRALIGGRLIKPDIHHGYVHQNGNHHHFYMRVPHLQVGVHPFDVIIDPEDRTIPVVRGSAAINPEDRFIRLLPSVHHISHISAGTNGGLKVKIEGTGFSTFIQSLNVVLDGKKCEVTKADWSFLECVLTILDSKILDGHQKDHGLPLLLYKVQDEEKCKSLSLCKTDKTPFERAHVGSGIKYPIPHPLRNDGSFRFDKFVADGKAVLVAPYSGFYTFQLDCSYLSSFELCDLELYSLTSKDKWTSKIEKGFKVVGPVELAKGQRIGWHIRFAHLQHGEMITVIAKYESLNKIDTRTIIPMPSEWLEFDAIPNKGVHVDVNGEPALCRSKLPEGCQFNANPKLDVMVNSVKIDGKPFNGQPITVGSKIHISGNGLKSITLPLGGKLLPEVLLGATKLSSQATIVSDGLDIVVNELPCEIPVQGSELRVLVPNVGYAKFKQPVLVKVIPTALLVSSNEISTEGGSTVVIRGQGIKPGHKVVLFNQTESECTGKCGYLECKSPSLVNYGSFNVVVNGNPIATVKATIRSTPVVDTLQIDGTEVTIKGHLLEDKVQIHLPAHRVVNINNVPCHVDRVVLKTLICWIIEKDVEAISSKPTIYLPWAGNAKLGPQFEVVQKSKVSLRKLHQSGEQKWSAYRGQCGSRCVIPEGTTVIMDTDVDVESMTIRGVFRWDTTRSGLVLRAGFVADHC
eukprot:NODE_427_length_2770_cov_69.529278_g366_i0.p1 GENE.NODE_427_length_2770_cov_69.529278_g366_i0~~NODE_427_length_2770_cov_69.529278_g366_i0.p1  ORF type:complete len:825 (-),score=138.60 NODE_427_length_2770_cov_69.529278_g366_i0:239-2713(-)